MLPALATALCAAALPAAFPAQLPESEPPPAEQPEARVVARVVRKGSRAPVPNAVVSVFPTGYLSAESRALQQRIDRLGGRATTDAEGTCTLTVPTGAFLFLSAHPADQARSNRLGFASRTTGPLDAGSTSELLFELPEGFDLVFWGRVLDGAAEPVADAGIKLVALGQVIRTTTDGSGRYRVSAPSDFPGFVRIEADGFGPRYVQPRAGHELAEDAYPVTLDRAATLVVALETGGQDEELCVVLKTSGYLLEDDEPWSGGVRFGIRDDEIVRVRCVDGVCRFENLPPNVPFEARITKNGKVVRRIVPDVVLDAGERREVAWAPAGSGRVSGTVTTQDGSPVGALPMWMVAAHGPGPPGATRPFVPREVDEVVSRTHTREGSFDFAGVHDGWWWVGVAPRGRAPRATDVTPTAQLVEVKRDAHVSVELLVHRGLLIQGRIVSPDGVTPSSGHVVAQSDRWYASVDADKSGAFSVGPLVPGAYVISASDFPRVADSDEVEAVAGEQGVHVRLREPASVAGRLLIPRSPPPLRFHLLVSEPDGRVARTQDLFVGPGGWFSVEGLGGGVYDLTFRGPNGELGVLADVELSPGQTRGGLEVPLVPSGAIRITWTGQPTRGRYSVHSGAAIVASGDLYTGTTATVVAPVGSARVELRVASRSLSKTVPVQEGETAEAAFEVVE